MNRQGQIYQDLAIQDLSDNRMIIIYKSDECYVVFGDNGNVKRKNTV